MLQAREIALEAIAIGRKTGDPRSIGLGLSVLAFMALVLDNYAEAIQYSNEAIAVAVAPIDRETGVNMKGCALVFLQRFAEGVPLVEEFQKRCSADGDLYSMTSSNAAHALSVAMRGNISKGIQSLNELVRVQDRLGYRRASDWYRLMLAELYVRIIQGNDKLPMPVLLRNAPILLRIVLTSRRRIVEWTASARGNPGYDPAGHFSARREMILGLMHKAKKEKAPALQHLSEARRITSQFGPTPMLARIDTALKELSRVT